MNEIKFDWILNGGTTTQEFQHTYIPYTTITMIDPVKENNEFSRWAVVKGNSTIEGNKLKLGDTDTIIYAVWEGTTSQIFEKPYRPGTTIELINPTRTGYIFIGWEVTSGNSIISGSSITMGSEDTTIKAKWK